MWQSQPGFAAEMDIFQKIKLRAMQCALDELIKVFFTLVTQHPNINIACVTGCSEMVHYLMDFDHGNLKLKETSCSFQPVSLFLSLDFSDQALSSSLEFSCFQ